MAEDSPTIATLSESGQFSVRIIPQMAGEATIQLEVELKTSDGLETVEKEIEWYEEYQGTAIMPVYGTDGSISGYDINGDGKIDDSADEIRHVELTPTFSRFHFWSIDKGHPAWNYKCSCSL